MNLFNLTSEERKALCFISIFLIVGAVITYINKENPAWIEKEQERFFVTHEEVRININKASVQELIELPGIGPVLAQRINNYRQKNGLFSSLEDLKGVKGIGDKKFKNIQKYIYLD
jgi:comEA protein